MKTKIFFLFLLISLLGVSQVKADTIYYNVPGTAQLCQDPLDLDTFVFHKPTNWPMYTPSWKVSFNGGSFINYQIADTFLFVPNSIGSYAIVATYSGIDKVFSLYLYSQPPAHAQFGVNGEGGINQTKDTVWMCDANVTMNVGSIPGSDATYAQWTGPGSFFSTNGTITVSLPGTYIRERGNPCGITRDTVEVVQLPTQLPTIPNILRCNQPLAETLDAGPGWFNYLWNTGATSQSIYTDTAGTFTVNLVNACTSGQVSVTVEQQNYPLPDLNQYSTNVGIDLCHGEIANLVPHPTHVYDTYNWRKGSDPAVISTSPTLNVDYQMGEGQYHLEITQGSCVETDMAVVLFELTPAPTEMCVATFDPTLGINKVVFQHDGGQVEDFVLCYMQGQNWIIVDSVMATQIPMDVYSLWDNVNDPNQQSRQYTVFARHSCGHMSPLGDWHKTIMVGIFQDDMSGNYVLLIMDHYETSSEYQPNSYTIWVDPLNDGNLTQVGVLDGGNSFVIQNPILGGAYYASVDLPWNCDSKKSTNVAFSNKRTLSPVGIEQISVQNKIKIFPNPSSGIFQIEGQISSVEVFDNLGRLILSSTNTNTIDLTDFGQGMYHAKIQTTENGPSAVVKLIVQ